MNTLRCRERAGGRALPVALLGLVALLGAGGGLLAGAPQRAAADPGTTTSCPSSNAPNELTLVSGTPQTSKLDSPFSAPFQVALANSNGCPVTISVAGTAVSFDAPSSGASGTFSASGSNTVTVGLDATGSAAAPLFTANDLAGSYTVSASSPYGAVSFALTNTAAGVASTIAATPSTRQAAPIDGLYPAPLQARVLDANGNPVEGASVTFALGSAAGGSGAAGAAVAGAGASFAGGGSQATELTNSAGIASSPSFSANSVAGPFTATAVTPGIAEPASFPLVNVAGAPPALSATRPLRRSARAGGEYHRPLQVTVTAEHGKQRLAGVSVVFTLGTSGGAGAGAGAAAGGAGATFLDGSTQTTVTTGLAGRATSPLFIANLTPGTFSATATVAGSRPVRFTLDNLATKPPAIHLVGATRRSALVDTSYHQPLQVKVVAANGTPLEGTTVTFTLGSAAGGSGAAGAAASPAGASFLGGSAQAIETTNAAGLATSPRFTANDTAGAFSASAAVAGITNPATFTLDNLAAKPPAIHLVGAARRSALVDTSYHQPLQVKVVAANGTPLEGTTVTFTLGSAASGSGAAGAAASPAGASFLGGSAQAIETTNAAGLATSPRFTANDTAGAFSASAAVAGITNPATFTLDNRAGRQPRIGALDAAEATATVGTRYRAPLEVRVLGTDGKPMQGATVTFQLGAGGAGAAAGAASAAGASFVGGSAQATETTGASGIAISPHFTADTTAGAFTATASVSGTPGVAVFPLRNRAGKPTTVTAGAAASESTTTGARFPVRLAVTVTDRDGNPVAGVPVTFTAPEHGATGSFTGRHARTRTVTIPTDASGIAVAPAFRAGRTAGGFIVRASVPGAPTAAFALVNEPSAP